MNSTALPYRYVGTHHECFAAASLSGRHTARVGNVTIVLSEKIALLLLPHVDRHSVQFGCYIT